MSREFEVTEGMLDAAASQLPPAADWAVKASVERALAHPTFRAQLRKWAAEGMRGLVPESKGSSSYVDTEYRNRGHNACRAETLANIEKWEQSHD